MKDTKRKSLIKAARKTAKKNIVEKLVAELKKISADIGPGSAKLAKVIAKESNKLAKRIAKEIKLDEVAIAAGKVEKPVEVKPVNKAEPVKAAGKKKVKAEVVTAS